MIAKISPGRGFRGATQYVTGERPRLAEEQQPERIGGNMAGQDARAMGREFEVVRAQRRDIQEPVNHVSLNFHKGDRPLTSDEMVRIAERYLEKHGFDREQNQYLIVRHRDKDYQHLHIVANRVRLDGKVTEKPWYQHNKAVCRELEQEFKLRAPERNQDRNQDRAPTRGEDRMRLDRNLASEKEQLKALIREAAQGRPTATQFLARLEERHVQVRPNMGRTGDPTGLSYRLDNVAVQGRKLGPAYSWSGVQKHLGVQYDARRDRPALERAAGVTIGREPTSRPTERPRAVLPARSVDAGRAASTMARAYAFVRDPAGTALRVATNKALEVAGSRIPGVAAVTAAARTVRDVSKLVQSPVKTSMRVAVSLATAGSPATSLVAKAVGLAAEIATNDAHTDRDHDRSR